MTKFAVEHMCMCSILLFGVVSVLLQMMVNLSLQGYVRASANMKTTKKKIMINLKNQFETIYGMGYQVRNTGAYVDKYLLKMKFMGLSYAAWEKSWFIAIGLVTLLAGGEAFYGYIHHALPGEQMEILFSYGVVLVCFFVSFHIVEIKGKKKQIQIQLVDYLENYLANRLIRTKEGAKELKLLNEEMEEAFIDNAARNKDLKQVILQEEKNTDEDVSMLYQLLKDMENGRKGSLSDSKEQIAASKETKLQDKENQTSEPVDSDVALLEEFVQSFFA